MSDAEKPRWTYRFDNYRRAFGLLRDAIETMQARELTPLEKEGATQRFEYTWELAWKVLKDFLDHTGVVLGTVTPASVLRAALAAKIISDGDVWMRALDARNRTTHTYGLAAFERIIAEIRADYLAVFEDLYLTLLRQAVGEPEP